MKLIAVGINLSVPRNIDPAAGHLESVTLYDMNDLGALARRGVQGRERELAGCTQIIEAHVAVLTEKLHPEEARKLWRSVPRRLSTTDLVPQPT
jgi:glutamyl-tRNA reductase